MSGPTRLRFVSWTAAAMLAVLPEGVLAAPPADPAERDRRFAPLAELAGSCWTGTFEGTESRDTHCWEWAVQGQFLRDRHSVPSPDSTYSGETLYDWDEEAGLRFWYFNSLGGVSTGNLEQVDGQWLFTESYTGPGGSQELRTSFSRPDDASYEVVTERREADGWNVIGRVRYARAVSPAAKLGGEHAQWDLAFNTSRGGSYDVARRDLRTGEERLLTSDPGTEWVYAGRPGGPLFIVSDRVAGAERGYRLYRVDPQTGAQTLHSEVVVDDSWLGILPDGRVVVCARERGDRELFLLDAHGRVERQLTDNEANDCQPDVTPDGRTVVFWSDRSGSGELWSMALDPGTPAADGKAADQAARLLTDFGGNDTEARHRYGGEGPPRVSPDGRRIAWPAIRGESDFDIYVMSIDGGAVRRLTDHLSDDAYPSWSPDGRFLAFDSDRLGGNDLFVVPADGGAVVRVTDHPGTELAPVWVAPIAPK